MAIKHLKVNATGDDTSLLPENNYVKPSDWNAEHQITPDTIANILSDHDVANHNTLGIDHTSLANIGTNTHDTIDSHLLETTGVHGINALDDGSNKIILNGTQWDIYLGNIRVAFLDSNGNLHIKGVVITEDDSV